MLTRIEALNFRCLRYVSQTLDPFHVLVGPNASGKTTFFDVVGFVSRLLNDGLEAAIDEISGDPLDLLFARTGSQFELAIDAAIPSSFKKGWGTIRYELSVNVPANAIAEIKSERLLFVNPLHCNPPSDEKEIELLVPPSTLRYQYPSRSKVFFERICDPNKFLLGNETDDEADKRITQEWIDIFKWSRQRAAFTRIGDFASALPSSSWFANFLQHGHRTLSLDKFSLCRPSPPRSGTDLASDGSNLPWIVSRIENTSEYADWIGHLRTAIPDIESVRTVVRDEDRHRYLKIRYSSGVEIPQWMVSDGTLRMLALTLPAFLKDFGGMLLIEEPENGIHPRAIETVFQAISGVTTAQVLVATHSPIILNIAQPKQILCFSKDDNGATDIIRGDEHPALVDWQHEVSLGTLFAGGALG